MTTLQWHFPTGLPEVLSLMKDGFSPHSGGTWLMKNKPKKGFIELSGVKELFRYDKQNGMVEAGSMLTFAGLGAKLPEAHLLAQALSAAASTTLRNRVTLGGSLAAFPVWSDIAAVLVLLDAEVLTAGAAKDAYPVSEYLADTSLRKRCLVTGLRFPFAVPPSAYFRQVRTTFDYPAFTVAAVRSGDGIRAAVGGTKERVTLYEEPSGAAPEIPGRFGSSSEYLSLCAAVELKRLVESLEGAAS